MSRIAIFWPLLVGCLLSAIAWWLKDVEHHLISPILGVLVGTLIVVSYHFADRQNRSAVKGLSVNLFFGVGAVVAVSATFFPAVFGFMVGLWLPALIGSSIFLVIRKRPLLWQDLR